MQLRVNLIQVLSNLCFLSKSSGHCYIITRIFQKLKSIFIMPLTSGAYPYWTSTWRHFSLAHSLGTITYQEVHMEGTIKSGWSYITSYVVLIQFRPTTSYGLQHILKRSCFAIWILNAPPPIEGIIYTLWKVIKVLNIFYLPMCLMQIMYGFTQLFCFLTVLMSS